MADMVVKMASDFVQLLLAQVALLLKDASQLQGARGLDLERSTSGDTPSYQVPELQLNILMVCEMFVQILTAGLGALALVWATVVLLGGFSTSIDMADFWVITAIVFIETARVVGLNVSPEAEFFNQVPQALLEMGIQNHTTWVQRASDFVAVMAFVALSVFTVPLIAGFGCISLSIYRLLALLSRHNDNSNVFRALILFYALVLLQGGLFIMSLILASARFKIANQVSLKYELEDKTVLIGKYMDKTLSMAIKNGVSSTINKNLASFATDLMKSDNSQNHVEAVYVIHALTSQEDHRTRTLSQIQSSPLCVARLLDMVTSKSRTNQKTKVCIAEIVAHLASDLRLADISGAMESISSMIDPCFTNISKPAMNVNIRWQTAIDIANDQKGTHQSASATNGAVNTSNSQQRTLQSSSNTSGVPSITNDQQGTRGSSSTTNGAESQPLIIHGLLILAKLAVNPDNCKQIYGSKGLFSKIISPVKNKAYEIPGNDGIAMEITEKALEVVTMLVSGTDETNGRIRRDICSNGIAVNDIRPILERQDRKYNKIKVPATKILTELYLDISTRPTIGLDDIAVFIEVLMNFFFDSVDESGLRKTAGKALAGMAMNNANCSTITNFNKGTETSVQLLIAMIQGADDRLYPTDIAQLLMQLCANSKSDAERERLNSVKTILHEVLKVICNVEQPANTNLVGSAQHNLGQQPAANRKQAGSPQHNLGQQQAANTNQVGSPQQNPGQQQAANINQGSSPQHNTGRTPLLTLALQRLNSVLEPRRSHAANRNASGDNLPAVARLVGGREKSLAAFLGLGLQICDKLEISPDEFDKALVEIHLSMGEFVDKLNGIIEQCKGYSVDSLEGKDPSVDYLIIIKTVTKLCTWMMHSKPDCITEFQNKNTSTKLQGALEDMRELELGTILASSAVDMSNNLSTIVATARQQMDANLLGRSG